MGAGLFCFVLCQTTFSAFRHDRLFRESHAKQRFQPSGMTACLAKVMPNNVFRPSGMTACLVEVMPNNVFRLSGMTACLAKVMPNNTFSPVE